MRADVKEHETFFAWYGDVALASTGLERDPLVKLGGRWDRVLSAWVFPKALATREAVEALADAFAGPLGPWEEGRARIARALGDARTLVRGLERELQEFDAAHARALCGGRS